MKRADELTKYRGRLKAVVDGALDAYEKEHGSASLRKLAESIGKPGAFNTLYKWQNGQLKQPIRAASFSLLCAIDPEGRDPMSLSAYLDGVEVSQLSEQTLQEQVVALYKENEQLKKQKAQMFQLATA